ncbi:MAG: endolytic transglycosylase MltG [Pseudomonadota bacterium]|nr:endolytic transglycosylase MltG [Pseudomonadota bacterium]
MWRSAVRFLAILISVASVAIGSGIFWAWAAYRADGPLTQPITIIIAKGVGVKQIAAQLVSSGAIENEHLFVLGARYNETARRMRAGEFILQPGMSIRAISDHLVNGEFVKRRLTIPEGFLTEEVVSLVAATDGLVGDVPLDRPEGIYLPDTYFFIYGDTRLSILSRMKKAMDSALVEVWNARDVNIAISSPREALILASIIECETGVEAERARVSSVFHNRIRLRMRLQSDPTVAYAVTGGRRPLGRPLSRADMKIDSHYNTYLRFGMPPGPIANPGRAALMAAVQPADTKDLYFVADGTGGHAFARTLAEHNRNVTKWRRIQRRRTK